MEEYFHPINKREALDVSSSTGTGSHIEHALQQAWSDNLHLLKKAPLLAIPEAGLAMTALGFMGMGVGIAVELFDSASILDIVASGGSMKLGEKIAVGSGIVATAGLATINLSDLLK